MTLLHNPKNTHVITELWAWVSEQEDGMEGIIALPIMPGMGTTPLVFSLKRIADRCEPMVRQLERMTGKKTKLVHFRRVGS